VVQVGHFWLTNGLAFAPRHGSALYIDVRLVTHCSDPCKVENASLNLEGRYGRQLWACARRGFLAWVCSEQLRTPASASCKPRPQQFNNAAKHTYVDLDADAASVSRST
jgi:hypothetical protein